MRFVGPPEPNCMESVGVRFTTRLPSHHPAARTLDRADFFMETIYTDLYNYACIYHQKRKNFTNFNCGKYKDVREYMYGPSIVRKRKLTISS